MPPAGRFIGGSQIRSDNITHRKTGGNLVQTTLAPPIGQEYVSACNPPTGTAGANTHRATTVQDFCAIGAQSRGNFSSSCITEELHRNLLSDMSLISWDSGFCCQFLHWGCCFKITPVQISTANQFSFRALY